MALIFATMLQKAKNNTRKLNWSKIGLGLSFVCAIHCIISPIFIAFLPIVGSEMLHNPALEIILLGSSFLLIGITNLVGFIRHHKRFAPISYMFLGFSLLLTGHLADGLTYEIIGALLGGCFLAFSLYINQKEKTKSASTDCCAH